METTELDLEDDICEFCQGTGEVPEDIFDEDSHEYMRGVGTKKCICQLDSEGD